MFAIQPFADAVVCVSHAFRNFKVDNNSSLDSESDTLGMKG